MVVEVICRSKGQVSGVQQPGEGVGEGDAGQGKWDEKEPSVSNPPPSLAENAMVLLNTHVFV